MSKVMSRAENGKVNLSARDVIVRVTKKLIEENDSCDMYHCPVALAIRDAVGVADGYVSINKGYVTLSRVIGQRERYKLPSHVVKWVADFDQKLVGPNDEFSFVLSLPVIESIQPSTNARKRGINIARHLRDILDDHGELVTTVPSQQGLVRSLRNECRNTDLNPKDAARELYKKLKANGLTVVKREVPPRKRGVWIRQRGTAIRMTREELGAMMEAHNRRSAGQPV